MSRSDVRRTLVSSISALTAGIALSACGSDDAVVDTPAPVASNVSTTVPVVSNPSTTPSTTSSSSTTPPLTNDIVLVEFPTAESVAGWSIQNDTVMGGVSSSRAEWEDGQLVFAGDLSLDNNGGFCSMRSPVSADFGALAAGATALTLTATGDDQVYVVQVRTDRDLFVQRITIRAAEDTYVLPLADFTATDFMLDAITPLEPLDPGSILQIAVYILDKQEGPFRLAIRSIGVV